MTEEEKREQHLVNENLRQYTIEEIVKILIRLVNDTIGIPDDIASRMVDYYPSMIEFEHGSLIAANTIINWKGMLKRAAADLWNQDTNNPDSAPTLWEDIAYKSGIRIAPKTFTATNAAAMGELMWFGEHIYRSGMAGNVYTPEQAPGVWEIVR